MKFHIFSIFLILSVGGRLHSMNLDPQDPVGAAIYGLNINQGNNDNQQINHLIHELNLTQEQMQGLDQLMQGLDQLKNIYKQINHQKDIQIKYLKMGIGALSVGLIAAISLSILFAWEWKKLIDMTKKALDLNIRIHPK